MIGLSILHKFMCVFVVIKQDIFFLDCISIIFFQQVNKPTVF